MMIMLTVLISDEMIPTKSRTIWPLPGGSANYVASLLRAISLANDSPAIEEYLARFREAFPTVNSDAHARGYLRDVLQSLDVLETNAANRVSITASGVVLLEADDPIPVLLALLREKVSGVNELIGLLTENPKAIRHLLAGMQRLGFSWRSEWPVRFRLNWLRAVGAVQRINERDSSERYSQWQLKTRP
jgi:hypothetical protein